VSRSLLSTPSFLSTASFASSVKTVSSFPISRRLRRLNLGGATSLTLASPPLVSAKSAKTQRAAHPQSISSTALSGSRVGRDGMVKIVSRSSFTSCTVSTSVPLPLLMVNWSDSS